MIANTPNPPCYAVIFTSLRTGVEAGYEAMAQRMVELAALQSGFLGIESAREGLGITVAYWDSEAAIAAWKRKAERLRLDRAKPRSNPPPAELFNAEAQGFADSFHPAAQMKNGNRTTQIRRYYDALVGWQQRVGGDAAKCREVQAFIKMLNAMVAYAKGRGPVDTTFESCLRDCIKQTTNAFALNHFRLHFEAVPRAIRP